VNTSRPAVNKHLPAHKLCCSAWPLRNDIARQLSEVEGLEGGYPETLAFLRLLNALLQPLVYDQRSVASAVLPYTRFVAEVVLGRLSQRNYRWAEGLTLAPCCGAQQHCTRLGLQGQLSVVLSIPFSAALLGAAGLLQAF
jgi:hypothetical protein